MTGHIWHLDSWIKDRKQGESEPSPAPPASVTATRAGLPAETARRGRHSARSGDRAAALDARVGESGILRALALAPAGQNAVSAAALAGWYSAVLFYVREPRLRARTSGSVRPVPRFGAALRSGPPRRRRRACGTATRLGLAAGTAPVSKFWSAHAQVTAARTRPAYQWRRSLRIVCRSGPDK
jgi:hypothetical protein